MTSTTREAILRAALTAFNAVGIDRTTIAQVRSAAGVSNGSFFHFFASKEDLASALFLDALDAYHARMVADIHARLGAAEGIALLVQTHLGWVGSHRPQATFLFEQVRSEWLTSIRDEQDMRNRSFAEAIDHWRMPHIQAGRLRPLSLITFIGQLIGPAQVLCRAWLSGRSNEDPQAHSQELTECACRALVVPFPITKKEPS